MYLWSITMAPAKSPLGGFTIGVLIAIRKDSLFVVLFVVWFASFVTSAASNDESNSFVGSSFELVRYYYKIEKPVYISAVEHSIFYYTQDIKFFVAISSFHVLICPEVRGVQQNISSCFEWRSNDLWKRPWH